MRFIFLPASFCVLLFLSGLSFAGPCGSNSVANSPIVVPTYVLPTFSSDIGDFSETDREDRWQNDRDGFIRDWIPKIGLPVERARYMGILQYFDHGRCPSGGTNPRRDRLVFDGCDRNVDKLSYEGHGGTDYLLSPQDYNLTPNLNKLNIINPFPPGAVVYATSISDGQNEGDRSPPAGNTIILTCYLDGNPCNDNAYNKYKLRFLHVQKNSFRVSVNQRVESGQILAKCGYSGGTDLTNIHVHLEHYLPGAAFNGATDPFVGFYNGEYGTSLFFNQFYIEWISHSAQTMGASARHYRNFRLEGEFYTPKPWYTETTWTFSSRDQLAHIWALGQWSDETYVGDIDLMIRPGVSQTYNAAKQVWEVTLPFRDTWKYQENVFVGETTDGILTNRVYTSYHQ